VDNNIGVNAFVYLICCCFSAVMQQPTPQAITTITVSSAGM